MSHLAISNNKYGERVPVQIGTQVINHLVVTMKEMELQQAEETWKQVHLSTAISKRNTMRGLNIPEYDLDGVKDKICIIKKAVILPFMTTVVKGIANLKTHSKCMNVVIEPVAPYSDHVSTARS